MGQTDSSNSIKTLSSLTLLTSVTENTRSTELSADCSHWTEVLDKHETSGHPVPAMFTRRIPEYRAVVDETKEIATAGDAHRLELLLNTCSELCCGYADRNHEKANKYFYRLQDNLISLADDELGMRVKKLNDQ